MNFWTKICVLIQCVHQPSRISFWLLYCNDKNCATLVSKTIEQNTVKNHAWIFQIEQKNWSKIMLFNALWKSTNNCVLCDLSKIELNSIKNWGLLVWNSGLAYFLVDIDIRQRALLSSLVFLRINCTATTSNRCTQGKNQRKSLIQYCERSELRLHLVRIKVH